MKYLVDIICVFIAFFVISCSSNTPHDAREIEGLWFEIQNTLYVYDPSRTEPIEPNITVYNVNNPEEGAQKWKISSTNENSGCITIYKSTRWLN